MGSVHHSSVQHETQTTERVSTRPGSVVVRLADTEDNAVHREVEELVCHAGGVVAIHEQIRPLVREVITSGAEVVIHVAHQTIERSLRLVRCVRRSDERAQVVAVVGASSPDVERDIRSAGAQTVLVWPEDRECLSGLIDAAQQSQSVTLSFREGRTCASRREVFRRTPPLLSP